MNKLSNHISKIVIAFFLGAIIVSFLLTGFTGFGSNAGSVGKVDDTPITIREYQNALQGELQRFSGMFGGKDLTPQQIRQFRIKEGVMRRLIQQKVMTNLAKDMELNSSYLEMKEQIKKYPFFLTDGKFDVNKYKILLSRNQLNPSKFEEMIIQELQFNKLNEIMTSLNVSDNYVSEMLKFKKTVAKVNAVKFDKESMTKYIKISKSEIKAFIADKKNESILNSLFKSMASEFNKPARVKGRHILLKVGPDAKDSDVLKRITKIHKKLTRSNFKRIAGKETEDPSGQGKKGGALDWFTKGRMVPAFEKVAFSMKKGQISKPVKTSFGYHIILVEDKDKGVTKTLKQVQNKVAKRHLQKSNRKALNEFNKNLTVKIEAALLKNDTETLAKFKKDYKITFEKNVDFNLFDKKAGSLSFEKSANLHDIFNKKETLTLLKNDEALNNSMLKFVSFPSPKNLEKEIAKSLESEKTSMSKKFVSDLQSNVMKSLEQKADIVTFPKML